MTISFHADFLASSAFVFMAIFARLGSMISVMPGFDSGAIPARIKLIFALGLSFVLVPMLTPVLPELPSTVFGLVCFILFEMLIGFAVGLCARLFLSAVQVAGTLIAFQSGLAFAQNFDPTQDSQGAITGSFLSVVAITLIFVMDLHHVMIGAIRDSYVLFEPAAALPVESFFHLAVKTVSIAFLTGVQMAMPVMASGFIIYVSTGVLAKLIPQVQVFFVIMPANILIGFAITFLVLSAMMIWFMDRFEVHLRQFLA